MLICASYKSSRDAEKFERILVGMKPLETVAESVPDVAGRVFPAPQVDIVVPVKDEEHDLGPSVRRLCTFLRDEFPFSARITIADNGSTDSTWAVATALSQELPGVAAVHMDQPGRGRALRAIWSGSDAEVLAYMDVDLSTDLNALLPLVAPLLSGHSDVAIGTRLARGSRVVRGPRREVISRSYNLLLRASLGAEFSDAQCGFKAIRREQARALLPLTEDTGWFFDTELLVLSERAGLRIHEVPVDWIDDTDSRVDIVATALADLRGIARLSIGLLRGTIKVPTLRDSAAGAFAAGWPRGRTGRAELGWQIAGFTAIGVASTAAYLLLYLLLRSVMADQAANALSLLITAIANTAANRRLTFGIRGRAQAARHQFKGLIAFGIGLALTSGSLAALNSTSAGHSRGAEVAVLVVANLVATVIRFVLFRSWVFGRRSGPVAAVATATASATPTPTATAVPSVDSDGSMS
jgi:putative flippase GtrA